MTVSEIQRSLEMWAPPAYQESYDNARLIVGDPKMKVDSVLCSLDCTEQVVQEAIDKKCKMIIAHHPIVFSGLKSLTGKTYVERTILKAIKNDIAIYALHTNLDNVWTGVNRRIGDQLGLEDLQILAPKKDVLSKLIVFVPIHALEEVSNAIFQAGGGHIGEYDRCSFRVEGTGTFRGGEESVPAVGTKGEDHQENEYRLEVIIPSHARHSIVSAMIKAHPYEEVAFDLVALENSHQRLGSGMIGTLKQPMSERDFMAHVSTKFDLRALRHTKPTGNKIERVAFCGGAGRFLLPNAIRNGADVFITSDFKYHEFFDAEGELMIMDIGHFESEQFTPDLIKEYLEEIFATFAVLLSEADTNPVQYYIA